MNFSLQTAIVLLFVLVAGIYLTRLAIRTGRGKSTGCTGCSKVKSTSVTTTPREKATEQKV